MMDEVYKVDENRYDGTMRYGRSGRSDLFIMWRWSLVQLWGR